MNQADLPEVPRRVMRQLIESLVYEGLISSGGVAGDGVAYCWTERRRFSFDRVRVGYVDDITTAVVSQFLSEMDGFAKNNQGVLILAASNVPWAIDSAFRRPGRATIAFTRDAPAFRDVPIIIQAQLQAANQAQEGCTVTGTPSTRAETTIKPDYLPSIQVLPSDILQTSGQNKRVLFVSEKMAALEVVYRRLAQCGLDSLCLEVHSHRANKRAVIEQLARALDDADPGPPSPTALVALDGLARRRQAFLPISVTSTRTCVVVWSRPARRCRIGS